MKVKTKKMIRVGSKQYPPNVIVDLPESVIEGINPDDIEVKRVITVPVREVVKKNLKKKDE